MHFVLGIVVVALLASQGSAYEAFGFLVFVGMLIQFISFIVMIVTWIRKCRIPRNYKGRSSAQIAR